MENGKRLENPNRNSVHNGWILDNNSVVVKPSTLPSDDSELEFESRDNEVFFHHNERINTISHTIQHKNQLFRLYYNCCFMSRDMCMKVSNFILKFILS